MATTDQLRKAENHVGRPALNDWSRERYIKELKVIGQVDLDKLSKLELFKRVLLAGIVIKPDWK